MDCGIPIGYILQDKPNLPRWRDRTNLKDNQPYEISPYIFVYGPKTVSRIYMKMFI